MMVARTAAHYGAVVRTSTQVVSLLSEGDRVVGVRVRDSEDGKVSFEENLEKIARMWRAEMDKPTDMGTTSAQ